MFDLRFAWLVSCIVRAFQQSPEFHVQSQTQQKRRGFFWFLYKLIDGMRL